MDTQVRGYAPSYSTRPRHADPKPAHKPHGKGHEKVLAAIMLDGRELIVELLDQDAPIRGKLVSMDSYTISLDVGEYTKVYYKHAIRCFYARRKASSDTSASGV